MPDIHLPRVDDAEHEESAALFPRQNRSRGRSVLKVLLEIALIATGVFLGLAGEQWRERAHRRELAHEALQRFRSEVEANRTAVAGVRDYHTTMLKSLKEYFAAKREKRTPSGVALQGIQPASFERTAWDLAISTQSLNDIDRDLAFALSRLYGVQQNYEGLSRGILQAMYVRTPSDNLDAFLAMVELYYADIVLLEPRLLQMYDELLPRIDRALVE